MVVKGKQKTFAPVTLAASAPRLRDLLVYPSRDAATTATQWKCCQMRRPCAVFARGWSARVAG
jgi:hypothetical protein